MHPASWKDVISGEFFVGSMAWKWAYTANRDETLSQMATRSHQRCASRRVGLHRHNRHNNYFNNNTLLLRGDYYIGGVDGSNV